MMLRRLPWICALLSCPVMAQSFSGRVVSVRDGDTLSVLTGERKIELRLAEIDAPELRQPFGARARESLVDLCLGKEADVSVLAQRRGPAVGRVRCDGIDASERQVALGLAWVYHRTAGSPTPLYLLEDQAQRSREGLWADRAPSPPWAYRANRRNRL